MHEQLKLRLDTLTQKECELIGLFHRRLAEKVIARELGCSPNTISTHKTNIFRKLEVTSMDECLAVTAGLIAPLDNSPYAATSIPCPLPTSEYAVLLSKQLPSHFISISTLRTIFRCALVRLQEDADSMDEGEDNEAARLFLQLVLPELTK